MQCFHMDANFHPLYRPRWIGAIKYQDDKNANLKKHISGATTIQTITPKRTTIHVHTTTHIHTILSFTIFETVQRSTLNLILNNRTISSSIFIVASQNIQQLRNISIIHPSTSIPFSRQSFLFILSFLSQFPKHLENHAAKHPTSVSSNRNPGSYAFGRI